MILFQLDRFPAFGRQDTTHKEYWYIFLTNAVFRRIINKR